MAVVRHVQVGAFQLDPDTGELSRGDHRIRLPDQSLRILQVLLDRPGEVVTREELRARLWAADTFVDFDAGLNNAVRKLRDALEDSSEQPSFIQTVPRRGYRLIAPIGTARTAHGRSGRAIGIAAILTATALTLSLETSRAWLSHRLGFAGRAPAIRSLVVVPFVNLSGDPGQEYFVDGITDAVTTNLARIRPLGVTSRTSAMRYKGVATRLTDIARELGVDAAVEGSVSRSGDRVVVRAQLIHAVGDRHLWADTFEADEGDLLKLQVDIAMAIARAVHMQIRPEDRQRLSLTRAVDADAYDAYLRGRFEWNHRTPGGMLKAIKYFEEAIAKDPNYARAYSGLSDTYRFLDLHGIAAPDDAMPKAEMAARQALALDGSLAEAHASLAGVLYRYRWDWQAAEREFRLSLELEPNYVEGRRAYGIYLGVMRRFDESLAEAQRAHQLDPLSLVQSMDLTQALFWCGRPGEAFEGLARARALFHDPHRVDVELAYEYTRQRRWTEAIDRFEKAIDPARPNPWLGFAYGASGRTADAHATLASLHELARMEYVSPQAFATVHMGLGDRDEVFRWLERAYEQRAVELRAFTKGFFEFVRDDPRFQDLLRRMGLAGFKEFRIPARS